MNGGDSENCVIPVAARGLRVLVVDQDNVSLIYIASVLEEQFYNVRTTELASVALSMIRKGKDKFDLVMADINMSEMDIFTFLDRVLLERDMPIIFMSVDDNIDVARKALNDGACFFLQKPMRRREITSVWQHVYRKRIISQKIENRKANIGKHVESNIERDSSGSARIMSMGKGNQRLSSRKKANHGSGGRSSGERSDSGRSSSKSAKSNESDSDQEKDKDNGSREKRMRWTPNLHNKFMDAISLLADKKTHPKAVLKKMNEPSLTVRHVASHLQKYRDRVHRINCAADLPVPQPKMIGTRNNNGSSGFNAGQEFVMTPNSEFGATTQQLITSPVSSSSSRSNSGTSAHYSLEMLRRALHYDKLTRNVPSSSTNGEFNAANAHPSATDNRNDDHQKVLGFDGSFQNYNYLSSEPNYFRDWIDIFQTPNPFDQQVIPPYDLFENPNYPLCQETSIFQGQTSTFSDSNHLFQNSNCQLAQGSSFFQGQTSTFSDPFQNPSYQLPQKSCFFQGQTSAFPYPNNLFENHNSQLVPESKDTPGLVTAPESTSLASFADLLRLFEAREGVEQVNGEPDLEEEDIDRYLEWFCTPPESDNEVPM